MRKVLLLLALLPATAYADKGAAWDRGYSTFTVTGVYCTTGTSVQLNATRQVAGFIPALYVLYNNDGADTAYIGHDVSVSTFTDNAAVRARRGYPLAAAIAREFKVSVNPDIADQGAIQLWCRAVDAAGASAVFITLMTFGYR